MSGGLKVMIKTKNLAEDASEPNLMALLKRTEGLARFPDFYSIKRTMRVCECVTAYIVRGQGLEEQMLPSSRTDLIIVLQKENN